jgi:hypothetical protein
MYLFIPEGWQNEEKNEGGLYTAGIFSGIHEKAALLQQGVHALTELENSVQPISSHPDKELWQETLPPRYSFFVKR